MILLEIKLQKESLLKKSITAYLEHNYWNLYFTQRWYVGNRVWTNDNIMITHALEIRFLHIIVPSSKWQNHCQRRWIWGSLKSISSDSDFPLKPDKCVERVVSMDGNRCSGE